jgi:hypothetical protein
METPDMISNWKGHEPATSAALLEVLTTATTGTAKVSRADRVLFTACEFWASASNGTLFSQLSEDAAAQLRAAEAAFTAIGLTKSAGIVQAGRLALTELDPPRSLREVALNIEKALCTIDEPVDRMIADFARLQAVTRHANP